MTPDPPSIPRFEVDLTAPDLRPWQVGNTGVDGFTSMAASAAGPHVLITALMHGNEIGGAIVLDRLLRDGLAPRRGRLTVGFLNLTAYARFDRHSPPRPASSTRI